MVSITLGRLLDAVPTSAAPPASVLRERAATLAPDPNELALDDLDEVVGGLARAVVPGHDGSPGAS